MSGPLKGPSKALKRHLAALEARKHSSAVPWVDPYEVAMKLMDILKNGFRLEREATAAGREFSRIPPASMSEPEQAAFDRIMRQTDAIHDRLMAEQRQAAEAKRANESVPVPAPAAPIAPEPPPTPVPFGSLRY